jgi:Protein of unknown function DUF262/HNH endonuclease
MPLNPVFGEHTIDQLSLMFKHRQINLEPGFQRRSVWTAGDRRRLVQSIFAGYPLPSVFLYQRTQGGRLVYDVIDGKQRLETIFMFMGDGRFRSDVFDVDLDLGDGAARYSWRSIRRKHIERAAAFRSYKLQTVQVGGELGQIIDLFVRINSTGKRLTSGEKRHARFYESRFLKEAERLQTKYRRLLLEQRTLTAAQISRMKGTELFSELLMSIHNGGPIDKKKSLDRAIGNDGVNGNTLRKLSREFVTTMNLLRTMFPDLRQTRFRNSAEFFSLFLLVWAMNQERLVLRDKRRNRLAFRMLRDLSNGIDALRDQLKKARVPRDGQALFRDYLLTVQGDTDSAANRRRRAAILQGLLWSLYERKDSRRTFSQEQRRILWNSSDRKVCARCKRPVSWQDFTVDHVQAYVRGGPTSLRNAQLMHRACNARKGAKPEVS